MNRRTDDMDIFDNLFAQIENDESSIGDFAGTVRDSMNEAARKKGYDSFTDMISSEISNSLSNDKPEKPKADTRNLSAEQMSRFDFMMEAIQSVTYEPKYQGYYEAGHRTCMDSYVDKMEQNKNQLCVIESLIKEDMKQYAKLLKKNRNDAYTQGYYDALVLLANSLLKSKKAKMRQIKKAVLEMKEKAQ